MKPSRAKTVPAQNFSISKCHFAKKKRDASVFFCSLCGESRFFSGTLFFARSNFSADAQERGRIFLSGGGEFAFKSAARRL